MSQTFEDDYQQDDDDQQQQEDRNPLRAQMRKLERDNKQLREQAEAGTKAARTLEFVKAGIDVNDVKSQYFVNGYQGDLTTDAIKAAATEAGFLAAPATATETVTAQEREALAPVQSATADAAADGARNWDAELASAKTAEEVIDLHRQRHGAESVKDD